MFIRYTARYGLASGVTDGDVIDLELVLQDLRPKFEIFKSESVSLDRKKRYTRVHGTETTYTCKTIPIVGTAANDQLEMFLWSVQDGQSFSADIAHNKEISMANYNLFGPPSEPEKLGNKIFVYQFKIVAV